MKTFKVILFLIINLNLFSKERKNDYMSIETKIIATDFVKSKLEIQNFLDKNNLNIIKKKENDKEIKIIFNSTKEQYDNYKKLIKEIGIIKSNNILTENNSNEIDNINLELKYLENKKLSYEKLILDMDKNIEEYLIIWKEKEKIKEKIFNTKNRLIDLKTDENYPYLIELIVVSELGIDEATYNKNKSPKFVNMPGVQYSYLIVENPQTDVSKKYYKGYAIKYLFTKGKTFISLGTYKANSIEPKDTLSISEMFFLNFGQDFYSRYLGQGKRNFLNLYSGYKIGTLWASSSLNNKFLLYLSPSLGLEIFKNKYILLDTRVNYFLPLNKVNKNLRGIGLDISFNFVF